MKRKLLINVITAVLLLVGVGTIAFSVVLGVVGAELFTLVIHTLLLLVSAWFLYKRHKLAVLLLAFSALDYFVSGWYAANSNGISISALIPAFYWSFALRVFLVVFVFYLLKRPVQNV